MSFLGEIKRRKVFQVAVAYAVVAWVLIEVASVLLPTFEAPEWVMRAFSFAVIAGFPLAVILSWVFDITPAGVVRTPAAALIGGSEDGDLRQADHEPAEPAAAPAALLDEAVPDVLPNSVAVLPLENLSPNPDDAYFAAGIHEEILNCLTKIKDLSVIARTSVKQYADTTKPISAIAKELGVGTIMEGSVRYAGDRVRVTAQLIDAKTADHIWSEVYERDLADIFAIQSDIATRIATALEATFSVAERQSIEKRATDSPVAYALYLKAVATLRESDEAAGSSTLLSGMQSALNQAIEIDPKFTLALVARARLYAASLNADIGTEENYASRRTELEKLALQDLDRALALDSNLGAAHAALAQIHQFNWRRAEAKAAYDRALELSPNDPDVLTDYGYFRLAMGKPEDAIRLANRALEVDPNNDRVRGALGWFLFASGDPATAVVCGRKQVESMPTIGLGHWALALAESALGNDAAALEAARIAERLLRENTNPVLLAAVAYAYGRISRPDDAARLVVRLEELATMRRVPAVGWALGYMAIGDDERALHWLNEAADNPEPYEGYIMLTMLKINAFADPRLDEPRFQKVRSRLGFQD